MQVWTTLSKHDLAAVSPDGIDAEVTYQGRGREHGVSRYHVKLNLPHDEHREVYRRLATDGSGRKVAAVCWHGFRDWMRAVFALDSTARIKTAAADYRGSLDFEASFEATGDKNIGSMMAPMRYRDACDHGVSVQDHGGGVMTARIQQTVIMACPHVILAPEHYREDGSCRCDDPDDPNMAEWGYTWNPGSGRWE